MMKLLKNSKGLSIIEVLVAAGIGTIVSLGIATMMQNSMTEQKRIQLYATLKDLKLRGQMLMQDPTAWSNTINGALNSSATFTSLKNNTAVTQVALTSPVQIVFYDSANQVAMNLFGPITTTPYSGNGYTIAGTSCSTFTSTGSDDCPISYKLLLSATCSSGVSCTNPQLRIVGKLLYSPKSGGLLEKFSGALNLKPPTNNDISDTSIGKYDIVVNRTSTQVNRYFKIATSLSATGTYTCASAGGGYCTVAESIHPGTTAGATNGWHIVDDPYSLVTVNGTSGNINFNVKGTYSCTINVPAFATQGFTAKLYNRTGPTMIASASTTAGFWAMSNAVIETKFNVGSTTDNYQLWQKCDAVPTSQPGDPQVGIGNCSLGMNTAPYGAIDVVTMNCILVDTLLM